MDRPRDFRAMEDLLRQLAPQVLGILSRRHGQFDACEDAVQEALVDATNQWPERGIPHHPRAWLLTVASRRLSDLWRSEKARHRREEVAANLGEVSVTGPEIDAPQDTDDTLILLFMCCHPSLTSASQISLTLRAVGGLTTAQIAAAFFVPEATMAQRISRAKQKIKASGTRFAMPPKSERWERLRVVVHVLYLMFNEGYMASSGAESQHADLTQEAIRLTRMLHQALPEDGEVTGLLALMLLTDARRSARTDALGELIPLADQDRTLWNSDAIEEGSSLITRTLETKPLGPYQVQAAIAAVHAEARRSDETDWPQVLALYEVLEHIAPSPVVTLNRAVAVGIVRGPRAGLDLLNTLNGNEQLARSHRLTSVRASLLELAGERDAAREAYRMASEQTQSLPERRFLEQRSRRLDD